MLFMNIVYQLELKLSIQ